MRIWHYKLLRCLPDKQFRGQLRELVLIMRDWRDKGTTNHLLINKVMEYPKSELVEYFKLYNEVYQERYGKSVSQKIVDEFDDFAQTGMGIRTKLFDGWHDTIYLAICNYNLYEKHFYAVGKSRISDDEWDYFQNYVQKYCW